ncbi:ABC transporter permease [Blautia sp.]|uniref:ABC transporter permease n=1 Tax=Blautia sp. TaxID=1955243 RepID=UPI002588319D|nr:ABC transporter permease [Blautia sp.]
MLNKLALRNAKRSFRDYLIYLLTMIFTAALMFSFDSMIFSDDVKKLCSEAGMMGAMLGLATFFIVLIMIWLVHYMMKFMAEKRSREFATYLLLGFHKKQIARLFLKEMLLLGLAAFFIGLLPGLFLQQVITTLIYAIVQADYTIRIRWNMGTFFMTAGIFFGSYVLAMFRSNRRFKKMNIREMMYLDRQNEELKNGNNTGKQWMFFASLILIVLFGWMLYFGHFNQWNVYPMIGALIASVYFLYIGLSAFLISCIRKGKAVVYRGANIFLLRQLASKVKTMQFTLGTLTILFMAALVGVSDALMLNQFQNTQAEEKYPFDVCIYSEHPGYDFSKEKALTEKYARITDFVAYDIYQNNTNTCSRYLVEQLSQTDSSYYFKYDTYIRLSDYNRLREMLRLAPVSLEPDQYLIHTKKRLKKTMAAFCAKPLKIQNTDHTCAGIYTEPFEQSGHNGADYLLVVPDETADSMTPYYSLMAASIKGSLPDDFYDQVLSMRGIHMTNDSYEELDDYIDSLDRETGSDAIYI